MRLLNDQLNHYMGDGARIIVQNDNQMPPVEIVI
jgi:hypothetical protein